MISHTLVTVYTMYHAWLFYEKCRAVAHYSDETMAIKLCREQ